MKSSLEIIAFSGGCELKGILGLIEVARDALDRHQLFLAAAHLDAAFVAISEGHGDFPDDAVGRSAARH